MSNTKTTKAAANGQASSTIATADAPFDLDAVEAEVKREPFVFTLGGRQWTLPHMEDMDRQIIHHIDQGNQKLAREAIRLGLGEDVYAEFDELPLSLGGVDKLFEAWMRHSGMASGNSQASTGS